MPSNNGGPRLVLTVHKVGRGWFDHTSVRPIQLQRILQSLADSDRDRLALTFDDGYACLADILPGMVEEFGLRPMVFIPTNFIGKANVWDYTSVFRPAWHLDRDQIRALASGGVEFGSHGHTHRLLTGLTDSALEIELRTSKSILEDLTGRPVVCISYPFGRYNKRVMRTAERAGYQFGFGSQWPSAGDPRLSMGRITLYGWDTPFSVARKTGEKWVQIEKAKAEISGFLSGGTIIYQEIRAISGRM